MLERAATTHLEPESGEEDKMTLLNDMTHGAALIAQFTTPEPLMMMGRDVLKVSAERAAPERHEGEGRRMTTWEKAFIRKHRRSPK
jgi:hypothetical protein